MNTVPWHEIWPQFLLPMQYSDFEPDLRMDTGKEDKDERGNGRGKLIS